jgi:hypothetical protein
MTSWIEKLKNKFDPPDPPPDNRLMEFKMGWIFDGDTKVIFSELIQENPYWGGDYSHYRYPAIGGKFWRSDVLGKDVHESHIFENKQDAINFAKERLTTKIIQYQQALEALEV